MKQEPADWARLTGLAYVNPAAGRIESDAALQKLETDHAAESAFQIAAVHSARGDADAALTWLERAVEERDAGVTQMFCEPVFRRLHGDPRWKALLKQLRMD